MSFLYFDCFSGVSGDMIIGALLDCGASWDYLQTSLASLQIPIIVSREKKLIQGISCTAFQVASDSTSVRHLKDIKKIIEDSSIPSDIKQNSIEVFNKLALAESQVHGVSPDHIHFHEIGAIDTIADIVGTFLCLNSLQTTEVYSSALPWSNGFVDISHGRYPLPAPATAQLLKGFPCISSSAAMELVTPTGAALITTIATPLPTSSTFVPQRVAYGAGTNARQDKVPNLLRVIMADNSEPVYGTEKVAVLETEVDDLNPEVFSYLHQQFTAHPSVLDYFTTPINMKKNRPGILITLITRVDALQPLSQLLMLETGSLGVRHRIQARYVVPRSESQIDTPWGPVRIKVACFAGDRLRIKPEFEDCQAIALKNNLSLLEVYASVNRLIEPK